MFWIIYTGAILFLTGLMMGSFFNVCIYRIPEGQSVITPPSHCPVCNHRLAALDLIPIASWIALGRKCRYCKAPIAARYPLVELLTGLLYLGLYLKFGISWELLTGLIFVSLMILACFIDFDHQIIPDRLSLTGLAIGIASLALLWPITWQEALIGAAIGGGILLLADLAGRLIFRKEGMGLGDVKLMAMAGFYLGIVRTVVALLLAIWAGALVGVVLLGIRRKKKAAALDTDTGEYVSDGRDESGTDEDENTLEDGHYMPFGPFLAAGCVFAVFFGRELAAWYLSFIP